jgi:hypothetical protein
MSEPDQTDVQPIAANVQVVKEAEGSQPSCCDCGVTSSELPLAFFGIAGHYCVRCLKYAELGARPSSSSSAFESK